MIKYDTLYTGYDPRTLLYRTVYQWKTFLSVKDNYIKSTTMTTNICKANSS